jgi:hypothetical protein
MMNLLIVNSAHMVQVLILALNSGASRSDLSLKMFMHEEGLAH